MLSTQNSTLKIDNFSDGGYQRIRKSIQDYPTMAFTYEESGDGYMITISYTQQKQSTEDTEGVNDLIIYIKSNPGLSAKQISDNLNVAQRTIERWLKQLKDQNKIECCGAPKIGGYYIK